MNTTVYSPVKSAAPTTETRPAPSPAEVQESFLHHLWASIATMALLVVICCVIYPLVIWGIAQAAFPVQANGSLIRKDGTYTTSDDEAVGSALLGQNFGAPQYFHPRPSAAGSGYDAGSSGGSNLGPISDKLLNGVTGAHAADAAGTQAAAAGSGGEVAASQRAPSTVETLSFDGVRLRAIHYALDNGIAFKLYTVKFDAEGKLVSKTEVPLAHYLDKEGNLKDTALVDAFPHAGDTSDKTPLIADDFATLIPADAVTASASGLDPHISPENARLQAPRVANARKSSGATRDQVLALIDQYTDQPSLGLLGDPGVNVLRLNLALDQKFSMPAAGRTP
jgi:potassium-transporting ATPase KdpC subunit